MGKGISLHLGLNSVDPNHYGGWSGPLFACEADARDMFALATERGFTPTLLVSAEATRAAAIQTIIAAAGELGADDFFLLTYSGHGGQLPDRDEEEIDGLDETWCLHDGQLIDDELYKYLGNFKQGVRIVVLSDSCHSGTVTKMAYHAGLLPRGAEGVPRAHAYRCMPAEVALRTYQSHRKMYDDIQKSTPPDVADSVRASVILISGCQDNQYSSDGAFNGLFTGVLLRVWKGGQFAGDYRVFHRSIIARMPQDQVPNFYLIGAHRPEFLRQRPFNLAGLVGKRRGVTAVVDAAA